MEKASVIIRVKNEKNNLGRLFPILKNQTYQDFEIVIVDDNSTDGSDKIVFDYFPKDRINLVKVPKGKFTYPYASNLGAKNAKGKYLVYLSAHSYPFTPTWLEDGLKDFDSTNVAGVFTYPVPDPSANFLVRIISEIRNKLIYARKSVFTKRRMGLLGTTNAIIRKDLWEKYNFNEKFYFGGEDTDWASYWLTKGYVIIQDPKFRVYHSHKLGPIGWVDQYLAWKRMYNFKPD